MSYYEWWGELDAIEVRFPERSFNNYWMVEGRPVEGWNDKITAAYTTPSPPVFDFGLADNAWPIFSFRMCDFLENAIPDVIQFLPFRLQRPNGMGRIASYSVGQVLKCVDCLDRKRTQVRENWQPINEFGDFGTRHPIVLSRQLIGDGKLFRVIGNCGPIVVSDEIKKAIEKSGFREQRFDAVLCSD